MEHIMIKRVDKKYDTDKAIKNLMKYIVRDKDDGGEVKYWNTRGLLKDLDMAFRSLDIMQSFMKGEKGRRAYHFIISMPEKVKDEMITYIVASAIADHLGEEYQLLFGLHTDTNNYHVHIAMNSINYKTGKKWHKSKKEFANWCDNLKEISEGVVREYNAIV